MASCGIFRPWALSTSLINAALMEALSPLHRGDAFGEGVQGGRINGVGHMLGQVFGVTVDFTVHIEQAHQAGQIDQGVAAILEQGANARQAVVGIEQRLVQAAS